MNPATTLVPDRLAALLPGVLLAAAVAAAAFGLRALPVPGLHALSPLMLAILIGMVVRNLAGTPASAAAGLAACMRRPLRLGIVLLGLQLTLAQVLEVGGLGLAILATAVAGTYAFTVAAGRLLGVDPRLAKLIGIGTAICGASAVIAANTVVRDREGGVPYALAVVTLYGTVAMFAYPLLMPVLALHPHGYGLWIGASVHEVAQVVAAGFAAGPDAGAFATITKLTRVLLLAPAVLLLGWQARRHAPDGQAAEPRPPAPWFVFGFLAMVVVASTGYVPPTARAGCGVATQAILAFALAAVGLETDFRRIAARGWRALALGALASTFVAGTSLALVLLLGENAR